MSHLPLFRPTAICRDFRTNTRPGSARVSTPENIGENYPLLRIRVTYNYEIFLKLDKNGLKGIKKSLKKLKKSLKKLKFGLKF